MAERRMPTVGQAVDAYRELRSTPKVAERFGCSTDAINRRLKSAGEPMRKPGEHGRYESREEGPRSAQADRVIVAYRRLGNVREAAELVGVPMTTAHGWLKARGVDTSDKIAHRLTRPRIADICERYEKGATTRQLAAELGCDKKTVALLLQDEGMVLRPSHGGDRAAFTGRKAIAVKHRYERGDSIRKIARDLGVSTTAVNTALRRRGVEMRGQGKRAAA